MRELCFGPLLLQDTLCFLRAQGFCSAEGQSSSNVLMYAGKKREVTKSCLKPPFKIAAVSFLVYVEIGNYPRGKWHSRKDTVKIFVIEEFVKV